MAVLEALRSWWASFSSGERAPTTTQTDDSFTDFADDLRDSLGPGVDLPPDSVPAAETAEEQTWDAGSPQGIFAEIASNYSQPIKDFVFDLQRGTATKDWIEVCLPVLGSLLHGAQSLDLDGVVQRMTEFSDALARAEAGEGRTFDEESKRLILERFDALARSMPKTFDTGTECRRRESIIIHSLLRQIPEVGHVTFEKLYGAGLTSLDILLMANAADMSVTTDVPVWLCEQICHKLEEYRRQFDGSTPSAAEKSHRERLVRLVQELKRHHQRLQQVADSTSGADKRESLRDRQSCMWQIDVLLAEMGEVHLVETLRTIAVDRRIEQLELYLGPADPTAPDTAQVQAVPENS